MMYDVWMLAAEHKKSNKFNDSVFKFDEQVI